MSHWRASLVTLAIALVASPVRAEPQADVAESLYREGKRQFDARRYDDACPKLAESQRLDPGGGTALLLGLCLEAQGRFASAVNALTDALASARRDRRPDREKVANEHLKAAEKRVARIVVHLAPAVLAEEPTVKLGDRAIPSVSLDTEILVDPGPLEVVISARGFRPARLTAEARSGEVARLSLSSLERDEAPPPPSASLSTAAPPPPAPPAPPPSHVGSYVLLGAGALALAVGGTFAVRSMIDTRHVNERCPATSCTDHGAVTLSERANVEANVANVALPLGLVAAAIGAYFLLAPGPNATASASVSRDGGSITLRGSF